MSDRIILNVNTLKINACDSSRCCAQPRPVFVGVTLTTSCRVVGKGCEGGWGAKGVRNVAQVVRLEKH